MRSVSAQSVEVPPVAPMAVPVEPPRRELVLVTDRDSSTFRRALQFLDIDIRVVASVSAALETVDTRTAGVILDAPLPTLSAEQALVSLAAADEARRHPVFVAVSEEFADDRARTLYDDGATAVVSWPQEVLLLPRLVTELADVSLADHEEASIDQALSEATQARIDVDADLASFVRCQVRNGVAHLTGTLDSLWKQRRLLSRVSTIPGVVAVTHVGLNVRAPSVADEALSGVLRTTLAATTDLEDQTVSVTVHDGVATLAGVVESKRHLRRVINVAESIRGVGKVDNHISISRKGAVIGQDQAATLQKLIDRAFPNSTAVVKSFGAAAVLTGTTPTLAERLEIEEVIEDVGFVDRVVNKLEPARATK